MKPSSLQEDKAMSCALSVPHAHLCGVEHLDAGGDSWVAFQHRSTLLQTGWSQAVAVGMEPTIPESRPENTCR